MNPMARIGPFEQYPCQYESWFYQNKFAYLSELAAVQHFIPRMGKGIEIGVGSGRFAAPLGIQFGVEPATKMIELAVQRNIHVTQAIGEALPFGDEIFDYAVMVTTICFLDDIEKALKDTYRMLKAEGCIVVGFVDRESQLGKQYVRHMEQSLFYREARFFSTGEVLSYLKAAGFEDFSFYQTIFKPLKELEGIDAIEEGYGKGSFIVIHGQKPI